MLRNLFKIGLITLLGVCAVWLIFGLLAPLLGLVWWLLVVALKFALIGAVVYGVVRVVSPETAKRLTAGLRK